MLGKSECLLPVREEGQAGGLADAGRRADSRRPWAADRAADGQWHHAAAVFDRQTQRLSLYLDGKLDTPTARLPPRIRWTFRRWVQSTSRRAT